MSDGQSTGGGAMDAVPPSEVAAAPTSAPAAPAPASIPVAAVPAAVMPVAVAASLREDQIQNAVSFLTHPKVRASPPATKRSFLQRKGLTEPEIDEAFRRVPEGSAEAAPAVPTSTPAPSIQGTGLVTYMPQPGQASATAAPLVAAAPQTAMVPVAMVPAQKAMMPAVPERQPVRWTQVVLGLGVVAASVYAVHTVVAPYLTRLYSGWSESVRARQEEQERQQQEAKEAAAALRKAQEQLVSATEDMASAARSLKDQMARADDTRHVLSELTDVVRALKDERRPAPTYPNSAPGYGAGGPGSTYGYDARGGGGGTALGGDYGGGQGRGDTYGGTAGYPSSGYANGYANGNVAEIRPPPGGYLGYGAGPANGSAVSRDQGNWVNPAGPGAMNGGWAADGGGSSGGGNGSGSAYASYARPQSEAPWGGAAGSKGYAGQNPSAGVGAGSYSAAAASDSNKPRSPADASSVRYDADHNGDGGFAAYANGVASSAAPAAVAPLPSASPARAPAPAPAVAAPAPAAPAPTASAAPAPAPAPAPVAAAPVPAPAPAAAAAPAPVPPAGARSLEEEPVYPQSFQEVMDMVSRGITPPNVRTDINDKPPDPTRPPSEPRVQPRPKPWERSTPDIGTPTTSGAPQQQQQAVSPSYAVVASTGVQEYVTPAPVLPSPAQWAAQPVMVQQQHTTTLSVLQPLAASGNTWQPPALPAPTIARVISSTTAAAGGAAGGAGPRGGSVSGMDGTAVDTGMPLDSSVGGADGAEGADRESQSVRVQEVQPVEVLEG